MSGPPPDSFPSPYERQPIVLVCDDCARSPRSLADLHRWGVSIPNSAYERASSPDEFTRLVYGRTASICPECLAEPAEARSGPISVDLILRSIVSGGPFEAALKWKFAGDWKAER